MTEIEKKARENFKKLEEYFRKDIDFEKRLWENMTPSRFGSPLSQPRSLPSRFGDLRIIALKETFSVPLRFWERFATQPPWRWKIKEKLIQNQHLPEPGTVIMDKDNGVLYVRESEKHAIMEKMRIV